MMDKYETVMGLEIHVELNTKTKMFCRCNADYFGKQPNTHTCPICLGLPGAIPKINKEAIKKCIQIGLALNCEVADYSLFERKNYFYPDLAKGFQTSQYRWPLTVNGFLDVEDSKGEITRIRVNRAHQEEDTGKLGHRGQGTGNSETLIDFNRSGVPLVEVVTEADFRDPSQVKDYAKKLQTMFRYLGVSDANMERGDMRLEANISVRIKGQEELPNYRVELKNINSFNFMVDAIEYEVKRQIEAIEAGEKLIQETRGWNQVKKETYIQRVKEEANDYRYFPEPDLPGMKLADYQDINVDEIKANLPELPWNKANRYVEHLGLNKADSRVLVEDKKLAEFFEECIENMETNKMEITPKKIANLIINQKLDPSSVEPMDLLHSILNDASSVISDDAELEKLCAQAIKENPGLVESYKAGKTPVIMALVGSVMKESQGKADAQKVKSILESLL